MKQIATRSRGSDWRGYFLIACVIILALLLAGTSWSAWQSSIERAAAEARQDYTLEVLLETDQLRTAALQQIRGGRGYLLTGKRIFLTPHTEGKRSASAAYDRLSGLLADDTDQAPRIRALKTDLAHLDTVIGSMIASAADGRQADALRTMRSGSDRDAIEAIIRTLDEIEGTERAALATRTAIAQSRAIANERYQYMLAGIGLLLLWLSILATVYVRKALAREHAVRRELEQLALTDPLTGLPNRRAFMKALTRSMARAELDRDRKLSLAIFDIDHFKRVNDLFGHPAGDAVIKEVGARASRALRQRDLVGRIGGEEFAVLLPRADIETARFACERLREAIAGAPIVHGDAIIPVTASIGIAEFQPGEDSDNLMICADAALYEAKTGGRNQVRLAA
ncbi:MAG: diguanylate cyclase [Qipengyuania sp.]|uniref:GGDEF domain-containing protein n=1 Tax=Qipengyuania sp. TaxID=2004515 RepID=UPI003002C588